ncbi:kinesin motor domain protein [Metarhizium robertsii]|uniref:Kinesin motor domain-containing protein n=2 Tax=Metarhizium robertsii TaxID=568076 RepID=E9EZQ6_METRA|nr:kinesin motor domain-containing protein [Metarhizium robertsii ARSEF 23]EFY99447.2 kinesin motor domain-containing protein [Metarhizium robertsii ARSEF 23]EXV04515.1 kinesin motor domain protein [Metarhizium robertsii]
MEEFITSNLDRYQWLLDRFKMQPKPKLTPNSDSSLDNLVCARIRPLAEEEVAAGLPASIFIRSREPGTFDAHELRHAVRGKPVLRSSAYTVDRSYGPDISTETIYEDAVQHLVPWVWGGGIGTLFAYGQTGSGKTFTISGIEKLAAKDLLEGNLEGDRKMFISVTEFAGNSAFDLLNGRRAISVLEDAFGNTQLAGALEHEVKAVSEVLAHIEYATKFRLTEATKRNDTSSRSHAVCRIRIEIHDIPGAEDGILYLVDLAGSEAARDRETHEPQRMKEAKEINVSLSVLKDCIRGKVEADVLIGTQTKKKPYVPFRQSALTKVLKHVFDPAGTRVCKNVIMACVNPCLLDISASRNTLRYAEMLRVFVPQVKGVKYRSDMPTTWNNEQLREWITANSGSPSVDATVLAPHETGAQLLRLPAPEFEARCMKTPGVIHEQAFAFRQKLWQLHVDSRRSKQKTQVDEDDGPDTVLSHLNKFDRSSSRELDALTQSIPFKDRIRPGMAVSWTPTKEYDMGCSWEELNIALILCPAAAVGPTTQDTMGHRVDAGSVSNKMADGKYKRYLCAMVSPAVLPGAFEVSMWRYVVVDVDDMDKEVILEYDSATRFYHLAV